MFQNKVHVGDKQWQHGSSSTNVGKDASVDGFRWVDVNFTSGKSSILKDCWGEVSAKQICAIMGPSGAGKSSLLNVLAGRSASAPGVIVTGDVYFQGQKINPVAFRKNIAYVMQDDAITPTSTPREALRFSASMRLPSTYTQKEIDGLVDSLLKELGLEDCADTFVGSALIKGISGGQRKRTSVGIEVITQPSLLFLDEPTSGLDSYAAFNIVNLLKNISQKNATVLCTIHQPSSEVFHQFDMVIIMKSGRILYHGSTNQISNYFSACGYDCPTDYNPSDYVMFVCQTAQETDLEKSGLFQKVSENILKLSQENKLSNSKLLESKKDLPNSSASFSRQIYFLVTREFAAIYRDVNSLVSRYGLTLFLGILFGLIFYNAAGKDDSTSTNFNSHFGGLTMVLIICMFGMAQPVMLSFPFERPIFLREYSTGTYSAPAYIFSKMILELPQCFLQSLFIFLLCFFLMDMQGNFILHVLCGWALGICSSSMAMTLGCVVNQVKDVTELAPLLFVPQLLFAGFFIKTNQIPIFLRWAQYLCSLKYAMNLVILNEFAASNDSCKGGAAKNCANVISQNNIEKDIFWSYILILGALFVFFRLLGAVLLVQRAKRFY